MPFCWYEPMWLEAHDIAGRGEGWKMVDDGETALDGSFPVNMSRRRAVVATRSARRACCASPRPRNQVRGTAGEHQVDGAKVALAQAYGANSQYFSMWVVASSLQPFG